MNKDEVVENQSGESQNCGGMILCGGKSSRMGVAKAMLPFGPETMLQRMVRVLSEIVQPIVVVAAENQELPELSDSVQVVTDRTVDRGPLEGIATGMYAIQSRCELAFVTSCDAPFLSTKLIQQMITWSDGYDIVVPKTEGYLHPLAAVYRTSVLQTIDTLLQADRLRPVFLFDEVRTRIIEKVELTQVDAELHSFRNLNRPDDYLRAITEAGFEPTKEILAQLRQE